MGKTASKIMRSFIETIFLETTDLIVLNFWEENSSFVDKDLNDAWVTYF